MCVRTISLAGKVILGNDFLRKKQAVINFENKTIKIDKNEIDL